LSKKSKLRNSPEAIRLIETAVSERLSLRKEIIYQAMLKSDEVQEVSIESVKRWQQYLWKAPLFFQEITNEQRRIIDQKARIKQAKAQAKREEVKRRKRLTIDLQKLMDVQVPAILELSQDVCYKAVVNSGFEDYITLKMAKGWKKDPVRSPFFYQKIAEDREVAKFQREMRQYEKEQAEENHRKVLQKAIVEKWKKGRLKNLTPDEREIMDDELFSLSKWLIGSTPAEAVEAGFEEFDQAVFAWGNVNLADHRTWLIHSGGCDQDGKEDSCMQRIEFEQASRREENHLRAGLSEISVMTSGLEKGDVVLCWYDSKLGLITKINKVSLTVKLVGSVTSGGTLVKKTLHPDYLKKITLKDYHNFQVDEQLRVKCNDGRVRDCKVTSVEDHFALVEYKLVSRDETRYCWIDPLRIQ
jgi:hypothetical protein